VHLAQSAAAIGGRCLPRWPKRHLKTRWMGDLRNKDIINAGAEGLFAQALRLASAKQLAGGAGRALRFASAHGVKDLWVWPAPCAAGKHGASL
jgi:hypothetical protein